MKTLAGTLILVLALCGCLAGTEREQTFHGTAMLPAIKDGDQVRLVRFDLGAPFDVKRGDIVMFLFPDDPSKVYIKRLVGLPGETVEVRAGKVFVNGKELAEPYVDPERNRNGDIEPPVFVKLHYYYVLGDNRDNSSDSRVWGLVPEKYILGKAVDR